MTIKELWNLYENFLNDTSDKITDLSFQFLDWFLALTIIEGFVVICLFSFCLWVIYGVCSEGEVEMDYSSY